MASEARSRVDIGELKRRLPLDQLVGMHVKLARAGREYRGLCPMHEERTPSFWVNPRKHGGVYHCFGCGASGDILTFWADLHSRNLRRDFGEVVRALADLANAPEVIEAAQARAATQPDPVDERSEDERSIERARRLWLAGQPGRASPVEVYLRSRGIEPAAIGGVPETLRYGQPQRLGDGWRPHAMIGAVVPGRGDKRLVGVHRTYLAAGGAGKGWVSHSGQRKAKLMLGQCWGGCVRLTPPAPHVVVGEGIETTLSALAAMGPDPGRCAVAALSLGNLSGASMERKPHPTKRGRLVPACDPDRRNPGLLLPEKTERVTIIADNDTKDPVMGRALVELAAAKWIDQGLKVEIYWPPDGQDANDVIRRTA